MNSILIKRQAVAQDVVNHYIFQDLEWGVRDCGTLAAHVLNSFGIENPLSNSDRAYKTALGATKFLKKIASDLAAVIDSAGIQRISTAEVLVGDLIAIQSDDPAFGWSLGVVVGPNKVMAFIEHDGRIFADTGDLFEVCVEAKTNNFDVIAWRVV